MQIQEIHIQAMKRALELAELGRFFVAPNPCVGAVLLKDNEIVAEGYHHYYGGDHAEVDCLKNARKQGVDTNGTTIVVTLEPCNHTGKTPPCTKSILEAGIKKVIIGLRDPHDIASGGIEFLESHGVEVVSGILEDECRIILRDYLVWIQEKRPFIILKMATSLDGKISLEKNAPYAITNSSSRLQVAKLRANIGLANGAVLIGKNTLMYDNPKLTARDVECKKQAKALVITSSLQNIDSSLYLIQERSNESIFLTNKDEACSAKAKELQEQGVRIYAFDEIKSVMQELFVKEKIPYILCEGGAKLATYLLSEELVDEYRQFIAPCFLHTQTATPLLNINEEISFVQKYKLLTAEKHEDDVELIYTKLLKNY